MITLAALLPAQENARPPPLTELAEEAEEAVDEATEALLEEAAEDAADEDALELAEPLTGVGSYEHQEVVLLLTESGTPGKDSGTQTKDPEKFW